MFEGFGRGYKIRAAQAQVEAKQADLADAELKVAVAVWASYQQFKVAIENLALSQTILDSADAAFHASQSRYRKGVSHIVELLNTQTALASAQQQRLQAWVNWHNSRIELAASVGNLNFLRSD